MVLLSKTECSALKGFAIIGIFMHNYLHWLGHMPKENEFQFFESKVNRFLSLCSDNPSDIILYIFSFFGHYGVPVFLFLSGYGLVKKYESAEYNSMGTASFIYLRFKKFFPMMLLGFVIFAMVDWITPGHHHWTWMDIIAQLTMTINFFPKPNNIIWPGQYWFFGLMMQLYIIYRVLLYKRHWGYTIPLIAICWLIQALCYNDPEGDIINRIRYNSIGGVMPFAIGIIAARLEYKITLNRDMSIAMFITSVLAIFALSMSFQTWLWVPLFVITMHIGMIKLLPQIAIKGLDWVGGISAAIFVCHAITRKIFIPISRHGDTVDGLVLYIVATILLGILFHHTINAMKRK